MKLDKDTRAYIAGCGGMLGRAVYAYFNERTTVKATDIDLNIEWLSYADVRDYYSISKSIIEFRPDLIMNLAALTDLEYCERNPEDAWLTNALGAENIALISNQLNVPMVYISTAGIFDGEKEVYHDFDEANPLSVYAKSKYYGELYVSNHVKNHFIFRAGWMMGGGASVDKKFVNKIFKKIKSGKTELYVVDDKFGVPTYTKNFTENMFKVMETDLYGVYNLACSGRCSRYDVAVEFVRLLGLEDKVSVRNVSSDFYKQEYFAPRPASEQILNLKLSSRKINFMKDWKECLKEYSLEFISAL